MKRLLILSLIGLFGLSCFFVGNSEAFEIVEGSRDAEDYNYGHSQGIWHMAHVKTSAPYYTVEWYIRESGSTEFVYQRTSYGGDNDPKVDAYFWPYWLSGSIKGSRFTIKAVAYPMVENPPGTIMDTHTHILTVFNPKFDSRNYDDGTYVYGELTRQYFDGVQISVDYIGHASLWTKGKQTTVYSNIAHELSGVGKKDENHPADDFNNPVPRKLSVTTEPYSRYRTLGFDARLNPKGGLLFKCTSDAYIRVVAGGRNDFKVPSQAIFGAGELPYGESPE